MEEFLTKPKKSELDVALDVGHDTIGWSVIRKDLATGEIRILGTGVVLFPADDCLACSRRGFRRQRRHIRATRTRIARIKKLILQAGGLSEADFKTAEKHPCMAPWKLAAAVLSCGKILTWRELWDVLRWYAHNRGYDGNRLASAKNQRLAEALAQATNETGEDDAEKEAANAQAQAKALLNRYKAHSMAETLCRFMEVKPDAKKIALTKYFKGEKAAFDRALVAKEVETILEKHIGKLQGLDERFVHRLMADPVNEANFLAQETDLPFPVQRRFWGGVLFGQLAPRFDNRIITQCPVSQKKCPLKSCQEFLDFRWAMTLANVTVRQGHGARPLSAGEIEEINRREAEVGGFSKREFKALVRGITQTAEDNLDALLMPNEAEQTLIRQPGVYALTKQGLRGVLDDEAFNFVARRLMRGKCFSLAKLAQTYGKEDAITALARKKLEVAAKRKNAKNKTLDEILNAPIVVDLPSGRAPYARPVMKQAAEEVFSGKNPLARGGVLYRNPTHEDALDEGKIDQETNNHLVRHRIKILLRLMRDIIRDYAENNPARIATVTIETTRELKEFSGKTNKQIEDEMAEKLKDFDNAKKAIPKKIEELREDEKLDPQTEAKLAELKNHPGFIRKVRIAEDMGWKCPYTGKRYDILDIATGKLQRDHIVPRSDRATDSLDSLVLTFSEVNEVKNNRTALAFIREFQGKKIGEHAILTETMFKKQVEELKVRGHQDDRRRQLRRKANLLRLTSDDSSMPDGMLTRTSHITKLSMRALQGLFKDCGRKTQFITVPGRVTAACRNTWKILGVLAAIDPRVRDTDGRLREKQEIRKITHMHHAVDAITLGLVSALLPRNEAFWAIMCKRRVKNEERPLLEATHCFRFAKDNEASLAELPQDILSSIRAALKEQRVIKHLPARLSGLHTEQNPWGVVAVIEDGKKVKLRQRKRDEKTGKITKKTEPPIIPVTKAFGLRPTGGTGKLQAIKGVLQVTKNYGVALTEPPTIIRSYHVWKQLNDLRKKNGGRLPLILRNGMLISIEEGTYKGLWRIASIKENASGEALNLVAPYAMRPENKVAFAKINAKLNSAVKGGIKVLQTHYTGGPAWPTISLTSPKPEPPSP